MGTALPLNEIYPPMRFQDDTWNTFRVMLRKKNKYENQQRAITPKYNRQSYDSCALHFSLMRSIHLCSVKMIPKILLLLSSGQKLNMKINKGQ